MINKGQRSKLFDMPVFEVPERLTTITVEEKIEPSKLETQTGNILFRMFIEAPRCKTKTRQERVAYVFNEAGMFGLGRGIFADRGVINSMMSCIT